MASTTWRNCRSCSAAKSGSGGSWGRAISRRAISFADSASMSTSYIKGPKRRSSLTISAASGSSANRSASTVNSRYSSPCRASSVSSPLRRSTRHRGPNARISITSPSVRSPNVAGLSAKPSRSRHKRVRCSRLSSSRRVPSGGRGKCRCRSDLREQPTATRSTTISANSTTASSGSLSQTLSSRSQSLIALARFPCNDVPRSRPFGTGSTRTSRNVLGASRWPGRG